MAALPPPVRRKITIKKQDLRRYQTGTRNYYDPAAAPEDRFENVMLYFAGWNYIVGDYDAATSSYRTTHSSFVPMPVRFYIERIDRINDVLMEDPDGRYFRANSVHVGVEQAREASMQFARDRGLTVGSEYTISGLAMRDGSPFTMGLVRGVLTSGHPRRIASLPLRLNANGGFQNQGREIYIAFSSLYIYPGGQNLPYQEIRVQPYVAPAAAAGPAPAAAAAEPAPAAAAEPAPAAAAEPGPAAAAEPEFPCEICRQDTEWQCSRCKQAFYCGEEHQHQHWYQGHRRVCRRRAAEPAAVPEFPCEICGQETEWQCSRCKQAFYCGEEHQRQHWYEGHRRACVSEVN